MGAPVIGAQGSNSVYLNRGDKQLSLGYRYQRSFRHFVGTRDQTARRKDLLINEVINNTHLIDATGQWGLKNGMSLALSVPFYIAKRSGRDGLDLVNFNNNGSNNSAQPQDNYGLTSRLEAGNVAEISDMSLILRKWLGSTKQTKGNLSVGLGADIPSGDHDVTRIERFIPGGQARVAGNVRTRRVAVDQSIQPGDGEWGIIGDLQGFRSIGQNTSLYLTATYLANPENINDTLRAGRTGASPDDFLSSADQYLVRPGVAFSQIFGHPHLHFAIGGRWEGVPVRDVFGDSRGFRRPGYAISIEPTLTRTVGRESFSLAVPVAVQRNRQASVLDEDAGGGPGDAAFADYLILTNYSRRW